MTHDHNPLPGNSGHSGHHVQPQLSVRVGQQVELLDRCDNSQDMVLVRLCPATLSEVTRPDMQEGYVPVSCLKMPSKQFQYPKHGDNDQGKIFNFILFLFRVNYILL